MVTVQDMANAREARRERQNLLLARYKSPVVSFTMNIAGPVKTSALIKEGFARGCSSIMHMLKAMGIEPFEIERVELKTGDELLMCAPCDAKALKEATSRLEEYSPIGRLWDIDVLDANGDKLERARPRSCLICDKPVSFCARSRAHSASELFERAQRILREYFEADASRQIASAAVRAVLYELLTTPKPGLVDRANNGSHQDMDAFTFAASAGGLYPYFENCARLGVECRETSDLFARLRVAGLEAERCMLIATGGVNTHKGTIFSLGILCAASGLLLGKGEYACPRALCRACVDIAGETLQSEIKNTLEQSARTAGQKMYCETGMTGARGEAAEGFPTALEALGVLTRAQSDGKSLNDAGVTALMHILTRAQDSNFVKRSSASRREEWIRRIIDMQSGDILECAASLDRQFIQENISPGGCADLLAAAFFMRAARDIKPVADYACREAGGDRAGG